MILPTRFSALSPDHHRVLALLASDGDEGMEYLAIMQALDLSRQRTLGVLIVLQERGLAIARGPDRRRRWHCTTGGSSYLGKHPEPPSPDE